MRSIRQGRAPRSATSHIRPRAVRDMRGATAAEYALLLAAILLVIVGALRALGDNINKASEIAGKAVEGSASNGAGSGAAPGPNTEPGGGDQGTAPPADDGGGGILSTVGDFFAGAFLGDFGGDHGTAGTIGQAVIGFIPIVGQIADVRDTVAGVIAVAKGEPGAGEQLAGDLAAFIPGAGNAAKAGAKLVRRADHVAEEAARNAEKDAAKEAEKNAGKDAGKTNQAAPPPADGAGDIGACFAEGTLIATCDGAEQPIETLREGDRVLSKNDDTGAIECRPLVQTFAHVADDAATLELRAEDGDTIVLHTTLGHPFWVDGFGWKPVRELIEGHRVRTAESASLAVVTWVADPTSRAVFNFEVEANHNYFVSDAHLLVHNGCVRLPVTSRISESPRLVREAEAAGRSNQSSLDHLTSQLANGNENPGSGTKPIGQGISEARTNDGARVYYRKGPNGEVEILGKSTKDNQDKVIKEVFKQFGR